MNIYKVRSTRIHIEVSGAEPVQDEYLRRPVQPEEITFIYFDQSRFWAEVSGYAIKKNGEPGQMYVTAHFRESSTWPDWLEKLANQLRPAAIQTGEVA